MTATDDLVIGYDVGTGRVLLEYTYEGPAFGVLILEVPVPL